MLDIQDLTWLHIALASFKDANPDLIAKCNTFEATQEKINKLMLADIKSQSDLDKAKYKLRNR